MGVGGGGLNRFPPPIFISENNRKRSKIMHSVDLYSKTFTGFFLHGLGEREKINKKNLGRFNPPPLIKTKVRSEKVADNYHHLHVQNGDQWKPY